MIRAAGCAVLATLLCAPAAVQAAEVSWHNPGKIAVSADGRSLYATASHTLSFSRNEVSGALEMIDRRAPRGSAIALAAGDRWAYIGYGSPYGLRGGLHILSRDAQSGLLTHRSTFIPGYREGGALGQVGDLVTSPDGTRLYVLHNRPGALSVFDIDAATGSLRLVQTLYGGTGPGDEPFLAGDPDDMDMAPDGRHLYVGSGRVGIFAVDAASGRLTALPSPDSESSSTIALDVSSDGRRVYAGAVDYGTYERDPDTGLLTLLSRTAFGDPGQCWGCPIAVSPDRTSVTSTQDHERRLRHSTATASGVTAPTTSETGDGYLVDTVWSPDGRFVYATSWGYKGDEMYVGSLATFERQASGLVLRSTFRPTVSGYTGGPRSEGVSINDGAIYTKDRSVEVSVNPPVWEPASFTLSNDSFSGAGDIVRIDDGRPVYRWTLEPGPSPRSVKHVYVRFTATGLPGSTDYSDDIILDQLAPQLLAAKVDRQSAGSRLLLRAKDNRSGVRKLQVTTRKSRPGKARRYAKKLRVRGNPRRVYVRVFDGAGNRSRWRTARR